MKEIENNKPCSPNEYNYGKTSSKKAPKVIICLLVLFATVGIITYKTLHTVNFGNINVNTGNKIVYFNMPVFDTPIAFTLGRPVLDVLPSKDNTIQADQNLGRYVESLEELNIVAINNDVVIVYIPDSKNALIDNKTKAAILEFQRDSTRGKTTTGLYTLWYESQDYSEIVRQTKTPAIVVAQRGKGTVTMSGNNVNEYMLVQAYQKVANENCCEYYTPNCCN
jgi:hypothetical protein